MRKTASFLKRFSAFLAVCLLALTCAAPALASESVSSSSAAASTSESGSYSYIRNWEEYTKQHEPAYEDGTWKFHDIRDAIVQVLDAGKAAMEAGDYDTGRQAGSDGYYGFYDLAFENATNMYISGSRVKQLEMLFGQLRGLGEDGNTEEYEKVADEIEQYVNEDADKLDGEDLDSGSSSGGSETASDSTSDSSTASSASSASSTSSASSGNDVTTVTGNRSATALVFAGTFLDILREGIEAIIVVAGIVAYLRVQVKNGSADKKKTLYPVYAGAILGIICSFIMAWILNLIRTATGSSSHQQELVEGLTGLLAVCVLFWTCNWMLSKSETEAWTAYIKDKTKSSTKGGNIFGLAFASFLAVFREGAEAVLFLQPYMRNSAQAGGVVGGVIVAGICLVVIYLLITMVSVRLPMRIFFNVTSIIMAVMCVCFLGSGLSGLIEAEVFNAYSAPWVAWIPLNNAVLDTLGIYPYVNTIVPQICLAIVLIIMFHFGFKKNREIRRLAEARKAVEDARKAAADRKAEEDAFRSRTAMVVYETLQKEGLVKALPQSVLASEKAVQDAEAADAAAISAAEAEYRKLEAENEAKEAAKKSRKKNNR